MAKFRHWRFIAILPAFRGCQGCAFGAPQSGCGLDSPGKQAHTACMAKSLKQRLKEKAGALGFDACGIARAEVPEEARRRLIEFVGRGLHGTMAWMETTLERRLDPRRLMPEARSAVVCAMSYAPPPGVDPLKRSADPQLGNISVYALGKDYHDVVKGKLKHLAQWLVSQTKQDVKVFVDTAPLMERALAQQAGIGWRGKHTCVLSRSLGNWFFIGVILTAAELEADAPAEAHCGTCTRCLSVCPTDAFIGPGMLDARRCISYLTIEHKGPIDRALRPLMGNHIFGCDDCLAICPWNKFAKEAREERLKPRPHLVETPLEELLTLNEPAFRRMFAGTPVRRAGYERFLANVCIATGNSGDARFVPLLKRRLAGEPPLVRAMAVWALSRLLPGNEFASLKTRFLPQETDDYVRAEWRAEERSDP